MVYWIGVDGGVEIGYTIGLSYRIRDDKLDRYPLGDWKSDSGTRNEVNASGGCSYGGI